MLTSGKTLVTITDMARIRFQRKNRAARAALDGIFTPDLPGRSIFAEKTISPGYFFVETPCHLTTVDSSRA